MMHEEDRALSSSFTVYSNNMHADRRLKQFKDAERESVTLHCVNKYLWPAPTSLRSMLLFF